MQKKSLLRKITLAFLFASMTAIVASSRTQQGARYELYSWKQSGVWYYALFEEGTRTGNYEESISSRSAIKGTVALEAALKKLSKGKEILWMSDAPQEMEKPDGKVVPDIRLPSRQRIKRVKACCDKLGLKLTLV
jgi:hypothetical protein